MGEGCAGYDEKGKGGAGYDEKGKSGGKHDEKVKYLQSEITHEQKDRKEQCGAGQKGDFNRNSRMFFSSSLSRI